MSTDTQALLLAVVIILAAWQGPRLLGGLHIWRRCQCGARYCTSCGRKEQ